jgi:two-component system NarL family sensor kinase
VSDGATLPTITRHHAGRLETTVAWLRLAAIGLFAAAERFPPPGNHDVAFFSVLGGYAVWSVARLVRLRRRPAAPRGGLVSSAIDILVITALSMLSSGPFSLTRLGYFFVPVTVAFRYRPALTLTATAVSIVAYVSQPLLDIGPDQGCASGGESCDLVGFVALQAGVLAWVGVACAALSAAVARRSREIESLAADRERLLAEALAAETRERRALAEGLHDGAVQSLLAARHDLEEVEARAPDDAALTRADDALLGVVRELRSAIFELHPHVLEEAGLEAAVRQLADAAAQRGGFTLTLELDQLPVRAEPDRLLFDAGRELLANVTKHAGAHNVTVTLHELEGRRTLSVLDDGAGFEPGVLSERLTHGHIGLESHRVRLESAGGELEVGPAPGGGTIATARVPA